MTEHIYAGVREILTGPEWEPVYVQDAGPFVTISGRFNGRAHAGSRDDWKSLAIDMDRIAREQYAHLLAEAEPIAVEPVVEAAPEPEPVSYNSGKIDEPEAEAVVEPEPAPVEIEPEPEPIPEPNPCAELMHELDALRAENARLRSEANAHNFPENLTDKLSDWDTVPDEASLTTADLTEEVIVGLSKPMRKKFTELLNVELAELLQERGGPRENLAREAECERLLDLFARVGSM